MTQTPMTTREAVEEALYCMAYILTKDCQNYDERKNTLAAMRLLCQQYGLQVDRFTVEVA